MKLLLVLLFITALFALTSDRPTRLGSGSLIIAGICSDGILIAADSRATYYSVKGGKMEHISYRDSCQKIFAIKGIPVAVSGISYFSGVNLSILISGFNENRDTTYETFDAVKEDFLSVLRDAYPREFDSLLLPNNSYFSGGYINRKPWLASTSRGVITKPERKIIYFNNADALPIFQKLYGRHEVDESISCNELKDIMEQTIIEFSKLFMLVGGPVSIIKIHPNNRYEWIQNNFSLKPIGSKEIFISPKDTAVWNPQMRKAYRIQ